MIATCQKLLLPHHTNNHRAQIWHPHGLAWLVMLTLIFSIWAKSLAQATPTVLGYSSAITVEQLLELTNRERTRQGLDPLKLNTVLTDAATQKGNDMLEKDYWAHVSPTGEQPWAFFSKAGYAYLYAGENLARDFTDAQSVVSAWMASPTHRENILNPHYQDIGFAIMDGDLSGNDTILIIQEFGKPRLANVETPPESTTAGATTNLPPLGLTQPKPPISVVDTSVPTRFDATTRQVSHSLNQSWAISITIILALVLAFDILLIHHHKIPRLTGRPLAHLIFVIGILVSVITSQAGMIR